MWIEAYLARVLWGWARAYMYAQCVSTGHQKSFGPLGWNCKEVSVSKMIAFQTYWVQYSQMKREMAFPASGRARECLWKARTKSMWKGSWTSCMHPGLWAQGRGSGERAILGVALAGVLGFGKPVLNSSIAWDLWNLGKFEDSFFGQVGGNPPFTVPDSWH